MNLSLSSDLEFLCDLLCSAFRVSQHCDEALVIHQGALRASQPKKLIILQFLHFTFIGRHILQQVSPLFLQLRTNPETSHKHLFNLAINWNTHFFVINDLIACFVYVTCSARLIHKHIKKNNNPVTEGQNDMNKISNKIILTCIKCYFAAIQPYLFFIQTDIFGAQPKNHIKVVYCHINYGYFYSKILKSGYALVKTFKSYIITFCIF